MATDDLEFLDKVTAFLESETLVPGFTPRKSPEVDGFQQLLSDESVPNWVAISRVDADPLLKDAEAESYKNSSSEGEKSSTQKNKRTSDTIDVRRQKYRQKLKNERDELRQMANELSNQVQELIEARQGTKTTARTDLVLSKSFWRQVATQQRKHRVRVEAEHKRLLAIVNSQGVYIENMGNALRECPKVFNSLAVIAGNGDTGAIRMHDRIDDLKWLRLKSSVSALYTIYLQDVDDCYARVDQVFRDAEFATLPIGVAHSSYRYKQNGDIKDFLYRNRTLLPSDFHETCHVLWELSRLPHRQINREVYHGVSDPENTIGVQFRIEKTLSNGETVSIMKHVASRRFIKNDRVVIVWKMFSEGEGIFSGMDTDETGFSILHPQQVASEKMTLMECYYQRAPVSYLSVNANNPAVKDFRKMMEDTLDEDSQKVAFELVKLLRNDTTEALTVNN